MPLERQQVPAPGGGDPTGLGCGQHLGSDPGDTRALSLLPVKPIFQKRRREEAGLEPSVCEVSSAPVGARASPATQALQAPVLTSRTSCSERTQTRHRCAWSAKVQGQGLSECGPRAPGDPPEPPKSSGLLPDSPGSPPGFSWCPLFNQRCSQQHGGRPLPHLLEHSSRDTRVQTERVRDFKRVVFLNLLVLIPQNGFLIAFLKIKIFRRTTNSCAPASACGA